MKCGRGHALARDRNQPEPPRAGLAPDPPGPAWSPQEAGVTEQELT